MRSLLLNPGPVTLSERVRRALLRPDLCHREPEFAELQSNIRNKLLAVYDLDPAQWAAVLLTGSGTAAVEAMVASLIPSGGTLVSIENGVYGERITRIARTHGIACRPVRHAWDAAIDLDALAATIQTNPGPADFVAAIHHETTTGRLNRLDRIAGVAAKRGVPLLIDAVSSFGVEHIRFDDWNVAACAANANKCLHGVPGAAFVIVRRGLLNPAAPARTLYLDLASYCEAQDNGTTPFTQSVQAFYALDEALAEFHEGGGREARREHYSALMNQVRNGLVALGVEPLIPEGESSCILSAFKLPSGVSYEALHDGLKAHGFIIYAGQGELARSIFRIAVMGEITSADIERLLATTGTLLAASASRCA
jgi:2-aminoethylphosphonate-pyruvate transaminase